MAAKKFEQRNTEDGCWAQITGTVLRNDRHGEAYRDTSTGGKMLSFSVTGEKKYNGKTSTFTQFLTAWDDKAVMLQNQLIDGRRYKMDCTFYNKSKADGTYKTEFAPFRATELQSVVKDLDEEMALEVAAKKEADKLAEMTPEDGERGMQMLRAATLASGIGKKVSDEALPF